ncbi:ankyrin repeat domain-containing protein [Zobellia laminariae]|uniref:ankyrin repeat domain-containing protein n=1 Tax=Zobellia laminariae TaxID=248906 RepID=UPI0026F45A4A|nr:ankyrin repeat domain-containing protein [Zobellia laminariae]WKX74601.1 ankyrin repeat domain-containing protein [Zobellia laminariae]
MRKSIIAFGILFSVMINSANANNNPSDNAVRSIKATTTNVSPLSLAVVNNDYETVKKFLELGSDVEAKEKTMGMTAVMYAARYNNVELVELLVSKGADLSEKSKIGMTALDCAKLSNASDVVAFIELL